MRLIHIWCDYKGRKPAELERHNAAKESWAKAKQLGEWITCAVDQAVLARNSKNVLRDIRPLPYVKDIIDFAITRSHPAKDDLLVFTNDDVCMAEGISNHLAGHGWGSRKDFQTMPSRFTEETISKGHFHPGADLFFFTMEQWRYVRALFPDMIYACQAWDLVMRRLLRDMNGVEIQNQIAHEMHDQFWVAHQNSPGNRNNKRLATNFFGKRSLPIA